MAFIYNLIKLIMGVTGPGVTPSWAGAPARPGAPAARPGEPEYPNELVGRINDIGTRFNTQFRSICNHYRTAVEHVLAKNNTNVRNEVHAHGTTWGNVGGWHPIGWGRTQARNYPVLGTYGPTPPPIVIPHDNVPVHGLIALVGAAAKLLMGFNTLSTDLRDLFNNLFSDADFLRLNDRDRETATNLFAHFLNLESLVLLFRIDAHDRYHRGQPHGPHTW